MTVGVISGYFAPLHEGHIAYIRTAKQLCDRLICIVNNDVQLTAKKGYACMTQAARLQVMRAIADIDEVVLSTDYDATVNKTLKDLVQVEGTIYFFNSGDAVNSPEEVDGVIKVFINLPKVNSSTAILKGAD